MEARRNTRSMEIAYYGAESRLVPLDWFGTATLAKVRVEKRYRHRVLDLHLRRTRTLNEARLLVHALEAGVPAPRLYYVDPDNSILVIEYVEGILLRDLIEAEGPTSNVVEVVKRLGYYTGILHENDIAHGDLTTSNVVVRGGEPVIIDFGLSEYTREELDKAVDIHLFLRSLESTHPEHVEPLYNAFLEGYAEARGGKKRDLAVALVERIRTMGRYVEERRLVWRQTDAR